MIQVDLDQLEAEVRKLASEFPNRTVQCNYVKLNHSGPECIIGTALYNLGTSLVELNTYEGSGCDDVIAGLLPQEHSDRSWFREVQRQQDREVTWGTSVDHADSVLERV